MNGKNKKKLYIGIGVLAIFLAWCVASLAVNSEFVFPTPWTVGKEFLSLLAKADFYLAVSVMKTLWNGILYVFVLAS